MMKFEPNDIHRSDLKVMIDRVLVSLFLAQIIGLLYYTNYFLVYKYLPSPFINDKNNTFMDLINTAYWAERGGMFTFWHTVYPPINFIFLKLANFLFLTKTTFSNPFEFREHAGNLIYAYFFAYLVAPIILLLSDKWRNIFNSSQKILIYFTIALSTPMLFLLERGNLVLACLFFIPLLFGSNANQKDIATAILINIKPYFLLLLICPFVKDKWTSAGRTILYSVFFFNASGLLINDNYLKFFDNLLNFSKSSTLFSLREVFSMPSSISVFSYLFQSDAFIRHYWKLGLDFILLSHLIDLFKLLILGLVLSLIYFNRSILTEDKIYTFILVCIVNLGVSLGGYSLVYYLATIPIMLEMRFKNLFIASIFLLFLPFDFIKLTSSWIGAQDVFLSGMKVDVFWELGLGSFLKPFVNFLLLIIVIREIIYLRKKQFNLSVIESK